MARVDQFTKFYQRKKQSKKRFDDISKALKTKNRMKAFARKKSPRHLFNPLGLHLPIH